MKTAILTIALALASAFSALAQTVMRENSTVYFQTNVFLHDDPTNPLHQRLSFEGQEPLWVAASNQVAYYQSSEMTNASIHARYLYSTNATLINANINAGYLTMTGNLDMGGKSITNISTIGLQGGELSFSGNEVLYEGDSAWEYVTGTNVWLGRVGDAESSRIAALAVNPMIFNSTSWLQSDGTNLFFVSTVPPGFTNALTTNTP
jgi:hypothetical protein